MDRRRFLVQSAAALGGLTSGLARSSAWAQAPAVVTPDRLRPQIPYGVQSGDVSGERAIIWSRSDRPARLVVEWATSDSFRDARRVVGPAALAPGDFTARVDLTDLPLGQQIFYRVRFQDLGDGKIWSEPVTGSLRTPPASRRTVTFAFSGDEAGQGWGINPGWGGMKLYEAMRSLGPDFFIHSGDQIYADGPIKAEVTLDDGSIWKNLTTPAKAKVAETLEEFRGAFAYNLLDANKRALRRRGAVPGAVGRSRDAQQLVSGPDARRRALHGAQRLAAVRVRAAGDVRVQRLPVRPRSTPSGSIARSPTAPRSTCFMLDERSYRGPNTPNRQTKLDDESAFLGAAQLRWLKQALLASRATWKVIASDMPLSIVVDDLNADVPKGTYEAWANGDHGAPLGTRAGDRQPAGLHQEQRHHATWCG